MNIDLPEMERRRVATEATLARFRKRKFSWRNRVTCLHLARLQLKNMGHKPPPIPQFQSAASAKKALTSAGFDSATALFDSMLERIPPAAMRLGDLAAMQGTAGLDSVVIAAGVGGKVFGWHQDAPGLVAIVPHDIKAAWRV